MASVNIMDTDYKQLNKFEIKCISCGSSNCTIEIDWVSTGSWNTTNIICLDCKVKEICCESSE